MVLPKDALSLGNVLSAGAVLPPHTQTLSLLPPALWCPLGGQGECPATIAASLYTETLVWTLLRAGAE